MPRYVVHVVRREIVAIGADVSVCAESVEAARAKAKELYQEDKIDDCVWREEDVWNFDESLEITSVVLDGLF